MLRHHILLVRLEVAAGVRLPQVPGCVGSVGFVVPLLVLYHLPSREVFLADHPLEQRVIPLLSRLPLADLTGRHVRSENRLKQSIDVN